MIQRWSSACLLLMIPLAIRTAPGSGDGGSLHHGPKAQPRPAATATGISGVPTTEPLPPLGLSVETTAMQKNVQGGIASLLFKVTASIAIEEAVLTARTPDRVVFADGSTAKTWKVDLAAGGVASVPAEVVVPEDGKYSITVEIAGLAHGKAIRRAASHKLLVGVKERKGKTKDGAIEYPAAETKPVDPAKEGA